MTVYVAYSEDFDVTDDETGYFNTDKLYKEIFCKL